MKNQRTKTSIGLFVAAVGVITLGADRIIASADSNKDYVESFSMATIIGLLLISISTFILFYKKNRLDKK